jgi:hypothetical protein
VLSYLNIPWIRFIMRLINTICSILVLFACNPQSPDKLTINDRQLNEVILNSKTPIIVFFHSGECSMCYGTLQQVSIDFPESTIISISVLKNTDLINSYLGLIGFKGLSVIDSSAILLSDNRVFLQTSSLFLIDNSSAILYRTSEYNKKDRDKIKIIIRKRDL